MGRKYTSILLQRQTISTTPGGAYTPGFFINHFRFHMRRKDETWDKAFKALNDAKDVWPAMISVTTAISAGDGKLSDIEKDRIYQHFVNAGVIDEELIKEAISKGVNLFARIALKSLPFPRLSNIVPIC